MTTKKQDIRDRAISGLMIDARDLVRVSRRSKGVLTLRHVWRDDEDGRVLNALRSTWRRAARVILSSGNVPSVEVYSAHGDMIDEIF